MTLYVCTAPPLPPAVNYSMEYIGNDTIALNISWTRPFTWSEFQVTSYTYMLMNESSGEPVQNARSVDTGTTQYQFVTGGNYCYKLRFSVSANNSLGMGNWSNTIIGHPIVGKVCYDCNSYYIAQN